MIDIDIDIDDDDDDDDDDATHHVSLGMDNLVQLFLV